MTSLREPKVYRDTDMSKLESEILKEHSKRQTVKIARWIGRDRRRFRLLMELLLHGDRLATQRSAWILSECADHHPDLIVPWFRQLTEKMQDDRAHISVKRNITHIFKHVDIPRTLQGTIVTCCFEYLGSPDMAPAVRANSMLILGRIAQREPGLKEELRMVIEQSMTSATAALRASARTVLKHIA